MLRKNMYKIEINSIKRNSAAIEVHTFQFSQRSGAAGSTMSISVRGMLGTGWMNIIGHSGRS